VISYTTPGPGSKNTGAVFFSVGGFEQTLYAAEDVELSRRLRHLGRFVILQEEVVTSGRNLRSHSAFNTLCILAGFALRGLRVL
jgi:hypothetical protein